MAYPIVAFKAIIGTPYKFRDRIVHRITKLLNSSGLQQLERKAVALNGGVLKVFPTGKIT